jgi:uncharacterized protein YcbX
MLVGRVAQIWRYPVKSMAGEALESSPVGSRGLPGDRGWALRDDTAGEIRSARRWPILLQCSARYESRPDGLRGHVEIAFPDGTSTSSDRECVGDEISALVGAPASLWSLQPATDRQHYRRAGRGVAAAAAIGRFRLGRRLLQRLLQGAGLDEGLRRQFGREEGEPLPDFGHLPGELLEFVSPPGTYFDVSPIHLLTTSSLAAMSRANPRADWNVRRFRPNVLVDTGGSPELVEPSWCGRRVRIGGVTLRCTIPAPRCAVPTQPQRDLCRDTSMLRTIVREGEQKLGLYADVLAEGEIAVDDPVELC